MGILGDKLQKQIDDYINVAELINLISEKTKSPQKEVISFLFANSFDELLTSYYLDEYSKFHKNSQTNDLSGALHGRDINLTYLKKSDVTNFEPLAEFNLFPNFKKKKNEYLTIDETIDYIKTKTGKVITFSDIVNYCNVDEYLTPIVFFNGYVGEPIDDKNFHYEKMKGYFYHQDLMFYLITDYNIVFNEYFKVYEILKKQTGEYNNGDDLFLFNNIPYYTFNEYGDGIGYECEQHKKNFHISEVKFDKTHIDKLIQKIGVKKPTLNKSEEIQQLKAELAKAKEQLTQAQKENEQLKAKQSINIQALPATDDILSNELTNVEIINQKQKILCKSNNLIAKAIKSLDISNILTKDDIAKFILPYSKNMVSFLNDMSKSEQTTSIKTIKDNHLKEIAFKNGKPSKKDSEKQRIDLIFDRTKLSDTEN